MNVWKSVKEELPEIGYDFLVYFETQSPLTLIAYKDIHDNYITQGIGDLIGYANRPEFSHWMRIPKLPIKEKNNVKS